VVLMRRGAGFFFTLGGLLLAAGIAQAALDRPVRVLVDQSREYSADWAALSSSLPEAGRQVIQCYTTIDEELLSHVDILVVRYDRDNGTWNAIMTEAAKRFARTGGGLLMIGHGRRWQAAAPSDTSEMASVYQLNRLAKPFGFIFESERGVPLGASSVEAVPSAIVGDEPAYSAGTEPGLITDLNGSAQPVLVGPGGLLVAGARIYGDGRVVACADPTGLVPGGDNGGLVNSLLSWLAPSESREVGSAPPGLLLPPVQMRFGHVEVAIPPSVVYGAELQAFDMALFDVGKAVEKTLGVRTISPGRVVALPGGTPQSVAPGALIAYGAAGGDLYPVLETAVRAIVASCIGPNRLPGSFQDAWVWLVTTYVLGTLGHTQAAVKQVSLIEPLAPLSSKEVKALDPLNPPPEPSGSVLCLAKAVSLFQEIEEQVGKGFWARFATEKRVRYALSSRSDVDAEGLVRLLEAVGLRDTRQFLRDRGVQVAERAPL